MALIVCKDCKKEFSTDAKRCPHCGAKKPAQGFLRYVGGILLLLFILSMCDTRDRSVGTGRSHTAATKPPQPAHASDYPADPIEKARFILKMPTPDTFAIASGIADLREINKDDGADRFALAQKLITALERARTSSVTSSESRWNVYHDVSTMDDSKRITLTLTSDNTIRAWLKQPRPMLVIRCRENKTEVYVQTGASPDPEYGRYDEATVRIRLDKQPAVKQVWGESTDREALFARNGVHFAKQLAKANQMAFEFTPFNSSPAIAEFTLTGLDTVLGQVATACHWKM